MIVLEFLRDLRENLGGEREKKGGKKIWSPAPNRHKCWHTQPHQIKDVEIFQMPP
jgi:hypothetical protein